MKVPGKLLTSTVIGGLLLAQPGVSRAQFKTPAFEVASIRINKAGGAQHYGLTPDGYSMTNMSLLVAVLAAYVPSGAGDASYFTNDRVLGAPEWLRPDRYDLTAKVDPAELAEWQKPERQKVMAREMVRALLVDRCKLVAHTEMREVPIYSLVVGKNGPKLKEAVAGESHPGGMTLPDGSVLVAEAGRTFHFYNASISALTVLLSNISGRTVKDNTGLMGRYDFTIEKGVPLQPGLADAASEPSIFTLLQEELGLKVNSGKGQVEMLVIDHMERPTEN